MSFVDYWHALVTAVHLATKTGGGLTAFLAAHVRVPRLADERKPWSFRGWLLPMAIDLEPCSVQREPKAIGSIDYPGRWGYWLSAIATGNLPESGIPRVTFGHGSDAGRKNMEACAAIIGQSEGFSSADSLMIDWLAWGLAVSDEPARVSESTQEELYRTFCLDEWHAAPADYLGWLMCEHKGRGIDPTGFFPTPQCVVHAMVKMQYGSDPLHEHALQSVCDPCVGSGRFLLEASNYSLRLFGQDINPRCVLATLINGAVFAPWITFPIPGLDGMVAVGDTYGPTASVTFDDSGQGLLFA